MVPTGFDDPASLFQHPLGAVELFHSLRLDLKLW
jgi:hypothetical protein